MNFVGTAWSLVPPIIAIALALITKEVYLSLFVGVLTGGLLYCNFAPVNSVEEIFNVIISELGDAGNIGILVFLVFLGIIVALMTKAGGSAAYGEWANKRIKTKRGALLSTFGLGALIFVDDYFNCLTVGSVMRPVTDKYNVSRAKLAYIIDATAAPVCIIAPISSWAAAVSGYTAGDGFNLFLQTIPYNLYAWFTMAMVVYIAISNKNFGPMKKHEELALEGDLFGGMSEGKNDEEIIASSKGKVIDLVLPVIFLILSCITCLVYTGGFFSGTPFIEAFANCNAPKGLVFGAFTTLVFIFILYLSRGIIKFKEYTDCIPKGFKMMVPAITILVLAWSLGHFCKDNLASGEFVKNALDGAPIAQWIYPSVLFVIALGLAFATGTSWGTFAVLIPIITAVFGSDPVANKMVVIAISSVLAGAVCGDHISPISDTTIMASAGAQCNHVAHVSTQIPYALTVAVVCFLGYIIAGISKNILITLGGTTLLFILAIIFVNKVGVNTDEKNNVAKS